MDIWKIIHDSLSTSILYLFEVFSLNNIISIPNNNFTSTITIPAFPNFSNLCKLIGGDNRTLNRAEYICVCVTFIWINFQLINSWYCHLSPYHCSKLGFPFHINIFSFLLRYSWFIVLFKSQVYNVVVHNF